MEIKVYTPRREESLGKLMKGIFLGFAEGRELAWRLFVRDRKASYRKSFLGFFWLFLPPLATASVWIFLNNQRIVVIQNTPMAYAGFTFCGTIIWSLFAESITKPLQRLQGAMGMMGKLNFPREAVILAGVYDLLSSLLLKLLILISALWVIGYPPTINFLPAVLCIMGLMFSGMALGVLISPLGLLYTDVGRVIPLALPFLMYLTPVIYPIRTGKLADLQQVNMVTPFLERARSLMGGYAFEMHLELFYWMFLMLILLLAGLLILRVALPVIVERSGS